MALGVFIGCLPLYGLHLTICWVVGFVLGLNRLKMYLAANISNPFVAPWLVFAEVQAGAWLRRGTFHQVTREYIASTSAWALRHRRRGRQPLRRRGARGAAAAATYSLVRGSGEDRRFADLVRRASDRYLGVSITAWEFARGKLRMDPIYRATLSPDVLVSGGRSSTSAAGRDWRWHCSPRRSAPWMRAPGRRSAAAAPLRSHDRHRDARRRLAKIAREALESDAEVIVADVRTLSLEPVRARAAV